MLQASSQLIAKLRLPNFMTIGYATCANENSPISFTRSFLHVKIDEDQITHQLAHRCQFTKLQIVIVCPTLLSLSSQFLQSNLKLLLKPERVLGMLLDVAEGRVWEIHKTTFPAYNKWRTCVVGDHEQSFVSELLGIATDILGRALRQQPLLSSDVANVVASPKAATAASHSTTGHQEAFTLFPRKVKVGQSKIIAILNEPMVKDDWIKIKIEKANEIIEITNIKRRNPYTIQFNIPGKLVFCLSCALSLYQ